MSRLLCLPVCSGVLYCRGADVRVQTDPSAYTVLQEIVRSGAADSPNLNHSNGNDGDSEDGTHTQTHAPEDVLLSIVYQFNNVSSASALGAGTTPPLSPDSDSTRFAADASRPGTAGSQFSGESTVSGFDPARVLSPSVVGIVLNSILERKRKRKRKRSRSSIRNWTTS